MGCVASAASISSPMARWALWAALGPLKTTPAKAIGVNRVALGLRRLLPVFPYKETPVALYVAHYNLCRVHEAMPGHNRDRL